MHPFEKAGDGIVRWRIGRWQMAEVIGQDEQALDQRQSQNGNHHQRDIEQYFADDAANRKERGKCRDSRQDSEDDRHGDPPGAADCGTQTRSAAAALGIDIFADNNRVVDHQTQCQNEAKKGEHVDT